MDLPSIMSLEENTALNEAGVKHFKSATNKWPYLWLSATPTEDYHVWKWANGKTFTKPAEP